MVLAAGFGTRMRPLTDDRPKALLEVAGRSLLDRALDRAEEAGCRRAVVNLHYRGDMIRRALDRRTRPEIAFSEEPTILETGGGVAAALPSLGRDPFLALNADAVWTGPGPAAALAAAWDAEAADALLLLVPRERAIEHHGRGDFQVEPGGRPARRGAAATAPFVFTGAQIVSPAAFADAPGGAFSMNLIWDRLIARGRLRAAIHAGGWVDVGTPAGLAAAEEALA
jgi:MurNAc alpha-1-phosphate uridylyltransferase